MYAGQAGMPLCADAAAIAKATVFVPETAATTPPAPLHAARLSTVREVTATRWRIWLPLKPELRAPAAEQHANATS